MKTTTPKSPVKHELIPLHEKISGEEKEKLLKEINVGFKDLPKMYKTDSAIADIQDVKQGDVIRITRKSSTAKTTVFYRGVVDA